MSANVIFIKTLILVKITIKNLISLFDNIPHRRAMEEGQREHMVGELMAARPMIMVILAPTWLIKGCCVG